MWIIQFILLAAIFVLLIPVFIILVQVLAAIFFAKSKFSVQILAKNQTRHSLTVLMPAHNESLVISQTIKSIFSQLTSQDQLLVVADNCTDDTATIARNLGATVLERSNLERRGKGYALDFGLQHLKKSPPQIIIIIDADCMVEEGTVELLANACFQSQRPVQALYVMESQPNPSLKARIAAFAWIVKNKVRPLGASAMGLPCQLMGTGMAFRWEDISNTNLASGHIVEDMKLGIDLARLNKAPLFLAEAKVSSVFPPTQEATNTQRARWEHGHLSVILSEAPRLFFEAIKAKNMQMFGLACDLIVPPLAVLTLLCTALLVLCLIFSTTVMVMLSATLFGVLFLAVMLAWLFFGRDIISLQQLCYVPIYALTKIPLYIKFFFNRQVEWVRSKRD